MNYIRSLFQLTCLMLAGTVGEFRVLAVNTILTDTTQLLSFDEFLIRYDKSYPDPIEYQLRREIYHRNLETIVAHNQQYLLQQHDNTDSNTIDKKKGHYLGITPYADMEATELPLGYTKRMNPKTTTLTQQNMDLPFVMETLEALPKAIDWRAAGMTTPVKNQGRCGSCWAFASTAVLESHLAITTGKLMTLSVQELVSCATNPYHCGGTGGCAGATAEIAFEHVAQHGMVQEWEFGYQSYHGEDIECSLEEESPTNGYMGVRGGILTTDGVGKGHYQGAVAGIEGYMTLPSNNYLALMNAVAKHGPVAVSVACLPWHLYQGGVFYAPLNTTKATDINHLVVLEGYGEDPMTGEKYWLIRNSWSPMWGEDGYIRLWRVDPSTLEDPDLDCGMDTTPADGIACTLDENGNEIIPPPVKICGNSGILYDATIPIGGHLL